MAEAARDDGGADSQVEEGMDTGEASSGAGECRQVTNGEWIELVTASAPEALGKLASHMELALSPRGSLLGYPGCITCCPGLVPISTTGIFMSLWWKLFFPLSYPLFFPYFSGLPSFPTSPVSHPSLLLSSPIPPYLICLPSLPNFSCLPSPLLSPRYHNC